MFALTLRGVRSHPFRYLATAIAIVLGIGFFTATSVLTDSFESSINDSVAEQFTDIDAAVRSTDTIESDFFELRQQIPAATVEKVRTIDGVAAAAPYLAGYAQVVTADGKTVDSSGGSQGFAWIDDTTLNPFSITSGRAPGAPTDVVIDDTTYADGGFAIGDSVRVLPLDKDQQFTIVGTIAPDTDNGFAQQALAFSFDGAATVLGTTDVDQIFVTSEPGTSQTALVADLAAALPDGLEAITGEDLVAEFQDLVGTFTAIIGTALQIFAGISLFVGVFVIYNTFSIIVAQRTREMALLRAIGASGRQVSIGILLESLVIGIIASLGGALAGIGLGAGLLRLLGSVTDGFDIALIVPPTAMVTGIVIGTIITVASAAIPARRGARIAPMAALRETAIEAVGASVRRTTVGALLFAGSVATSIWAVTAGPVIALAFGLPALVVSVFILGPAVVGPFAQLVTSPMVRAGSITGELARENARRNPKRSATTSLTLMIGVALVTTAAIFAATLSSSLSGQLDAQIRADHVIESSSPVGQNGGLSPSVATDVAALEGVDAAAGIQNTAGEVDGTFVDITGIDAAALDQVLDLEPTAGSLHALDATTVALSTDAAKDQGLAVGDDVSIRLAQNTATLTVAATYDRTELVGAWLVDTSVLEANLPRSLDTKVLVATAPGAEVGDDIDEILAGDPTARLKTTEDFIADQAGQIDNLLILLYGLLAMSVVVALIGIVNTMALSIHERTRELGLLRAVGMTNRQLRATVRSETVIVSLMGTVIGLALGLFFGWLVGQTAGDVFSAFTIPWGTLVIVTGIGIVAGIAAGILPARRATRIDILDAVASE